MHYSIIIAGLAAATAYASPLNVRQASKVTPSGFAAPSGFITATSGAAVPTYTAPSLVGSSKGPAGAPASTGALGVPTAVPNPATPSGLIAKLLTEDNNVARFKDIQKGIADESISLKFDFNPAANPAVVAGQGGQVDLAARANFPILTDTGISAAGIFFKPCGLNTPHIHPRATEFFTLVTEGVEMSTGFVMENGITDEFNTTLTQFQGTVFPMGSIHWQQNLACKPAVGIAGLNSEDPGASSIAQNFLINTSADIVDAALGFPKEINADNFAQFRKNIPISLANGVEECLVRCHIAY